MTNNLTPEQRMEQECERSLNQAKQTMQIIDAVINHLSRPAPRHIPTAAELSDYDTYLAGETHDERQESRTRGGNNVR